MYNRLKYDSINYKDSLSKLDINRSYYLINERDKPNYAYMSWRMNRNNVSDKYKEMGEGYFLSSIILLEQCLCDNSDRKGDAIIFPILFNIEQGIELYIKAFIYLIREKGVTIGFRIRIHDIKTLLANFKSAITAQNSFIANISLLDINYVEKFIDLLFEKTTDCTYARFPTDKSGNVHFYAHTSDNIIVDMQVLIEWVKSVFYILDRNYLKLTDAFESRGDV